MSAGGDFLSVMRLLVAARVAQGVTQLQIARRIGVSRQAIAAWENGVNVPAADKLFVWASFLGLRLSVAPAA
jgi:transcriptional regulator with XRE-family HTH domain